MNHRKQSDLFPCNTHIHTPYSFSSFGSIEDAVATAKKEGLAVLGINDFATCDGFSRFAALCEGHHLYPLFNIEFAIRDENDRSRIERCPIASNNGDWRLCGKAIAHPPRLSPDMQNLLADVWRKSQDYIWSLIDRLNGHLRKKGLSVILEYNSIRKKYAVKIVSERHVAKALYDALTNIFQKPADLEAALVHLFGGISVTTCGLDPAKIQNELFNRLLKKGSPIAGETDREHPRFQQVCSLILEAGGIPCYTINELEGASSAECEKAAVALSHWLLAARIFAVEFLPSGAEFESLTTFAHTLSDRGFCITFGTGHDASDCPSLLPALFGNETLERISWEGACMLAAHQELRKQNKAGFVGLEGELLVSPDTRNEFIAVGGRIIRRAVGWG